MEVLEYMGGQHVVQAAIRQGQAIAGGKDVDALDFAAQFHLLLGVTGLDPLVDEEAVGNVEGIVRRGPDLDSALAIEQAVGQGGVRE